MMDWGCRAKLAKLWSPLLTLETLGHRAQIVFEHEGGLISMERCLSAKVVMIYGVRLVGHADGDQKPSAQMTQISEPHLRRSVPIHVGESIQTKILPTTSSSSAR